MESATHIDVKKLVSLPRILSVFATVVAFLALACVAAEVTCAHIPRLAHLPYTGATLSRIDDYADIRMFLPRMAVFHTPAFFIPGPPDSHFLYPAPVALFYGIFSVFPDDEAYFLRFLWLTFAFLGGWLLRELVRRGVAAPPACLFVAVCQASSYPFYFEYNRGNMEIFIWGLSALGVLAFLRDRPWLAAVLIGVAGACKLYPLIYLGLLVSRRQFRQVAGAVLVGAAYTVLSLWVAGGNVIAAQRGVAAGLEEFRQVYVLHRRFTEIGLDHSIFGLFKSLWPQVPRPEVLAHYLTAYLVIAAVTATALYFFRIRKMPVTNQVLFLSIACILLPPVSYDYTLLHLYTPWTLLVFLAVRAWQQGKVDVPGLWPAFVCLMLLLSPQSEFIFHGQRLNGQLKCLELLALAGIALHYPFPGEPSGRDLKAEAA